MSKDRFAVSYMMQLRCPGYDISDSEWEVTGPAYSECWQQINSRLSEHVYVAFGTRFHQKFDWSQLPRLILRMHRAHERLFRAMGEGRDPLRAARFPRRPARITIQSTADKRPDYEHRHSALIECRLHDVFLIANLCAPGAGDFSGASFKDESRPGNQREGSLNLSGFYFNLAFIDTHEGKWPFVKSLPVEVVQKWYSAVRVGYSQVPKNRAEKVLFALLHLSALDMSPMAVLWIFFALETLFDTRTGENFRVLMDRIELLLCPDAKQRKHLRRQLRDLYDVRSAFVHGGFDLFHPLMNEALDEKVQAVHLKWTCPTEFGFRVLLVSLQTIVDRGITWPRFSERIEGENYAL